MSSRITKMSMIYGRYGVGLHFDYVQERAAGFLLKSTSVLHVNQFPPWVYWVWVHQWRVNLMTRTWNWLLRGWISSESHTGSLSWYKCPLLSPPPEQGREFSQPWSSARSRAIKMITRKQVKQHTRHKKTMAIWPRINLTFTFIIQLF